MKKIFVRVGEAINFASLFCVIAIYVFKRDANVSLLITSLFTGFLWTVFTKIRWQRPAKMNLHE